MDQTEETPKSKLDLLKERWRSQHPDDDFDDDDAFYGKLSDDLDAKDNELKTHREQAQLLTDMFAADPRSANFLQDIRSGEDPVLMMVRRFGSDIKEILDDPDKQEAIAEANKQYLERIASERQLEDEYERNIEQSLSLIEQMQQKQGLSDDDINEAFEFLLAIVRDGVVGKFTPETIELALKATRHDSHVASAREEGEVAGRNTKITETLRTKGAGDGLPNLSGAGNPTSQPTPRRASVFDLAKGAK